MSKLSLGGFSMVLLVALGGQGCALRNTDDRGAELQLEIARLRAAEQAERVAELEARLARLEQGGAANAASSSDPAVLERLDRLIALNQEVLMQSVEAAPLEELPAAEQPAPQGAPICDPTLTPQAQLQRFVEHLRGRRSTWRGGLSREEAEALRVLLRPERPLDPRNPLRHW